MLLKLSARSASKNVWHIHCEVAQVITNKQCMRGPINNNTKNQRTDSTNRQTTKLKSLKPICVTSAPRVTGEGLILLLLLLLSRMKDLKNSTHTHTHPHCVFSIIAILDLANTRRASRADQQLLCVRMPLPVCRRDLKWSCRRHSNQMPARPLGHHPIYIYRFDAPRGGPFFFWVYCTAVSVCILEGALTTSVHATHLHFTSIIYTGTAISVQPI